MCMIVLQAMLCFVVLLFRGYLSLLICLQAICFLLQKWIYSLEYLS